MFKKVLASFFVCLLLVCPMTLVGCKKGNNNQNSNPPSTTPGTTPEETPAPSNPVVSIAIDGTIKNEFYKGELLNINGVNVIVTYQDSTTKTVVLSDGMISGFDTTTLGEKSLTVSYEGKTYSHAYSVRELRATNIEIETPFNTNYYTGSQLNISNGEILVTYENGKTEILAVTAEMISDFDTSEAGEFELTLTHAEYSIVIDYTVSDAEVTTITVKSQFKTTYFVGDNLNISGGEITVNYEDGKSETVTITAEMIGETFNSETAGSKIMTITYKESTVEVPYRINAIELTSISLESTLDKVEYYEGDDLDVTGGTIRLHYNNGSSEVIPITLEMTSGFSKNYVSDEEKTLTITYNTRTTSLKYKTLKVAVTSLTLTQGFKTTYFEGDNIDLTGGRLTATYNNGVVQTNIVITDSMIANFDTSEAGSFKMTIKYDNISIEYDYTVVGVELVSIELTTAPTKTTYYVGDSSFNIDWTGAKITLYYNNGTTEVIKPNKIATNFSITNFSTTEVGENKVMTLTYTKNKSFTITCTYSVVEAPAQPTA